MNISDLLQRGWLGTFTKNIFYFFRYDVKKDNVLCLQINSVTGKVADTKIGVSTFFRDCSAELLEYEIFKNSNDCISWMADVCRFMGENVTKEDYTFIAMKVADITFPIWGTES